MDGNKVLGEHVRAKRKGKKLRQEDVSAVTGLSRNYLSDIECGRYTPSVEALTRLAVCLDLDLNVLKLSEIQTLISQTNIKKH